MSGLDCCKLGKDTDLQKFIEQKLGEYSCEVSERVSALNWLRENIFRVVNDASWSSRSLHTEATNWLEWARSREDLKIVTVDVPDGILPKGTKGRLRDVKVFARHGPDDALYDCDQDLRERVARGNCFLEVLQQNGELTTICVIHALKKFTGGLGDDDDRTSGPDIVWQRYFTQPLDTAKVVLSTKKQNGEAAHLAACRIGGEAYVCAGSKNVHLIFRSSEDLDMYPLHEPRYKFAREISNCVLEMLGTLSESCRVHLIEFLCTTRSTAVFELLSPDHQHVEDLSELVTPVLKFIAWTSCHLDSAHYATEFCGLPPDSGIELAKMFELDTIDYGMISLESSAEHMDSIRLQYGVEGEVLFFLDEHWRTIGILKKKSVWYILVRAIREKVNTACVGYSKNPAAFVRSSHVQKINLRLAEIQHWLQLSDDCVSAWKCLAEKFLAFTVRKLAANDFTAADLASNFPVYWKLFLLETGETDRISF